MLIGCHVSIAGGIEKAPERAADLGCETMQIFTRSPQGGKTSPLTKEIIQKFQENLKKFQIQNFVIHTPYYINLASVNNRIRYGSVKAITEELERANSLGAEFVMTHLGSAKEGSRTDNLEKVCQMLQESLEKYSGKTRLLLENSAGAGQIIGDDLSELATIIKCVGDPKIAGICLDTQHSFASGYDWRDFDQTLQKIDRQIGLDKIKLFHVNDSLTELGSKKDRHAHIGQGQIGAEPFQKIVSFAQKNKINLILETQHDQVREDIEILKKFQNS